MKHEEQGKEKGERESESERLDNMIKYFQSVTLTSQGQEI